MVKFRVRPDNATHFYFLCRKGDWYEHLRMIDWVPALADKSNIVHHYSATGAQEILEGRFSGVNPTTGARQVYRGLMITDTKQDGAFALVLSGVKYHRVVLHHEASPTCPISRAVVCSPDRDGLWYISRDKTMTPDDLQKAQSEMQAIALRFGFVADKLKSIQASNAVR